jgi:hypothetical protein
MIPMTYVTFLLENPALAQSSSVVDFEELCSLDLNL